MHRHNIAVEKLAKAKEQWYEEQVEEKNKMTRLRQQLQDANTDIATTDKALDLLAKIQHAEAQAQASVNREPRLSDYYHPSEKMQKYQNVVLGVTGVGGGYLLSRMIL